MITASGVLKWLVAASIVTTAVLLVFGPMELGLFGVIAYLVWRVIRIGLIVWVIRWLQKRRGTPAVAAAA